MVLKNGSPKGSIVCIPKGGQTQPIATDGDKLLWKKHQNIAKNNITSDATNSIKPCNKFHRTFAVWCPSFASWIIFQNQQVKQKAKPMRAKFNWCFMKGVKPECK